MNRKGQIAYSFIPVIALIAFTAAILAMLSARENLNVQAQSIIQISNELEFTQVLINSELRLILQEAISSCKNCEDEKLKELVVEKLKEKELEFRYVLDTNTFAKIRNREFFISSTSEQVTLSIEEFELFIKNNENELRRTSFLSITEPKCIVALTGLE